MRERVRSLLSVWRPLREGMREVEVLTECPEAFERQDEVLTECPKAVGGL